MAFMGNEEWPLRLLRKQRVSAHPVKHLILMQLLDMTVDQLRTVSQMGLAKAPPAKRSFEVFGEPSQERKTRRERFLAAALVQRTTLRKAPDYVWLYRHDRHWLKGILAEHRPGVSRSSPRADWANRDVLLAMRIRDIARKLLTADDPHRLSAAFLSAQTGKRATIEKFGAKLPQTTATIEECAESIDAYRCRRVRAVVRRMREAGIPVTRWQVLRQAGLKEPLSNSVEEALKMYLGHSV